MRPLTLLSLLSLAACNAPEGGLTVFLVADPAGNATHAMLFASGGGVTLATQCLPFKDATRLRIGVASRDFGPRVTLTAQGFEDPDCARPTFSAGPVDVPFKTGEVLEVTLSLVEASARTETACGDGADDDGDGLTDCEDPDCAAQSCGDALSCSGARACRDGACAATTLVCDAPPSCHGPGTCVEGSGCVYPIDPSGACSDGDPCTTDHCALDGGCASTPITCDAPPAGACWKPLGLCDGDGGCRYVGDVDAGCTDGNACTVSDRCQSDGTCRGVPTSCPARDCFVTSGQCNADGGCLYAAIDAGSACGAGGQCNPLGACLPPFPLYPSNVDLSQLPPAPAAVVYDCGVTVINSDGTGAPVITNACGEAEPGWATLQVDSKPVLVLTYSDLTVQNQATLQLVGARPVIIISTGSVTVFGTILAQAGAEACSTTGGAGRPGTADLTTIAKSGAGGGAFTTAGGKGGDVTLSVNGGAGGSVDVHGVLRGGCAGGVGEGNGNRAAAGGGALQLSVAKTLTIAGHITAPGLGGAGGSNCGGNGGGSGGDLLLEAARIIASGGGLTANGGGGGEGGTNTGGAAGTTTLMAAPGGRSSGRAGGDGAVLGTAARNGTDGPFNTGGGGGGLGRIRLNVSDFCNIGPQVPVSPAAQSNQPDAGCTR